MWLFKLLGLFSTILFLTQCHLPSTQKREDLGTTSVSSFYVEKLSGNFLSEALETEISIPKQRTFAFKACLKDLKKSKPVINHPFFLEELKQELKSDASGCLSWNESFDFNYLTDPTFVRMERTIQSKGLHTGSEKLNFAINLWDVETYKEIIDLNKTTITPLLEGESVKAKISGSDKNGLYDLWLDDGRLFVTDEKMGNSFQLRYDLSLQPFIKFKKTSGEISNYQLKHGLFKGQIEVIQRFFDGDADNNQYQTLSKVDFDNTKMEKGILSVSKVLNFSSAPSRGNIYVRISLEAQKNVPGLKPFVGIFPVGDYKNIRSNQFLKVSNNQELNSDLNKKLPSGKSGFTPVSQETDTKETTAESVISIAPLTFDPLNGSQVNYHKKVVRYNVTACFSNNLVTSPLVFQKFKVTGFSQDESKPGEVKDPKKSNHLGCIYWTDSVEFDMYDCHQFYRGYVIIENPHFNLKEKRYYYINPWEPYSFGTDEKKIDNANVLNTSCDKRNPKKSEIVLEGVSFENHGQKNDDRINSKLELEVKRFFGITLHPKVSIPSDIRHDYNAYSESLSNGFYLLRVAIFRNFHTGNKTEIIAHKDIPVLNKNNIIYGAFDFFIKDKRLLETRNTVLLQLLPVQQDKFISINDYTVKLKDESLDINTAIDKDSKLLSPIYMQEMSLDGDTKYGNLRTFSGSEIITHLGVDYKNENKDFNLNHFIAEFKSRKTQEEQDSLKNTASPADIAKQNDLLYFNGEQKNNLKFSSAIQKSLDSKKISFDKNMAENLCEFWFDKMWKNKFNLGESLLKRACSQAAKNNIKAFFDFDHVYIVKSIASSQYLGPGSEKNITTATNFSLSTSLSKYTTTQASLAGKIGAGLKGSYLSAGSEFAVQMSTGSQSSNAESNSLSLSESSSLQVSESHFKITTSNYDYCLSIKPKPSLFYNSGKNILLKLWDGDFDYSYFFKSTLSDEEKLKTVNSGILVCSQTTNHQPVSLIEQYYWIQQQMNTNEVQDAKDERTKIFNILLRGNQDYARFKMFLSNKWENPQGSALNKTDTNKIFNNLMQLQSFKPTLPGVYLYREQ